MLNYGTLSVSFKSLQTIYYVVPCAIYFEFLFPGIENMKSNFTDLIWLRNYVVAPISEEFTFRACIIPLLLQCFQPMTAVFICPVFFGAGR